MTERARQVLADCRIAQAMLEEETNLQRWRVHWAGAIALTRAIGHVLEKVDGQTPDIQREAKAAFKRWKSEAPEHEIFREFIERERNNILKEYEFNIHPLDEVHVVVSAALHPLNGGDSFVMNEVFPIDDNVYRPILDGYREGDDARDVLFDALDWWEVQLTAIDKAVILSS